MAKRKKDGVVVTVDDDGTPLCNCHDERMVELKDGTWICKEVMSEFLVRNVPLVREVPESLRGPKYQ